MTLPSALWAVAALIAVVVLVWIARQLLLLLWPRSLVAKLTRVRR